MATRAELEAALNNPNARKFLDLLSYTEGTQKNGYATAFGGGRINDLSRHPKTSASFTQTDGKKNSTTAAGRYQFLGSTWDEQSKKLGLSDFGAKSQDLAALSLAADSGALKSILSGDFKTAIGKTGTKWASLPSSPYPQGKKSWDSVNKFLGSNMPSQPQYNDVQSQEQQYDDGQQAQQQQAQQQQEQEQAQQQAIAQQQEQARQAQMQQQELEQQQAQAQQLQQLNQQQQENLNIQDAPDYSAQLAKAFGVMPQTPQIPDDISAMIQDLYENA